MSGAHERALMCALVLWAPCTDGAGLIVERVGLESAAARAGIQPGDRLLAWEQAPAAGALDSAFELLDVELERAPRGPVRLRGEREGQPFDALLTPDDWRLEVRPELASEAAASYAEARRQIAAGDVAGGSARLRGLADGPLPQAWQRAWLLRAAARAALEGGQLASARGLLDEAARISAAASESVAEAHLRTHLAHVLGLMGRLDEASTALRRALELWRSRDPESLGVASALVALTAVAGQQGRVDRGQLAEAQAIYERNAPRSLAYVRYLCRAARTVEAFSDKRRLFEQAVSLSEELAPEGLDLAASLFGLAGWVTTLEHRDEVVAHALAIQDRLVPDSQETAQSLSLLAIVLADQGDTATAVRHARRAVSIVERRLPGSFELSRVLTGLGIILDQRGDLAGAEAAYRRALELSEALAPGSFRVATQLHNLGVTLQRRGDLAGADTVLAKALAIGERQTGQRHFLAECLGNLGIVARDRGDYARAEAFYRRAITIHADVAPELVADVQMLIAELRARQHKPGEAEALYREALQESEARQPLSDESAQGHQALGELALERGDLEGAAPHLERALAIREQRSPGTQGEAESAHALGLVARRRGQPDEALALLQRAVTALEAQVRLLGGAAETGVRFRGRYQRLYRDLEDLQLEQGRNADAFGTLERSRATGLLALMAARDLDPPGLPADLERERRQTDREYDGVLKELAGAPAGDTAGQARLRQRLAQARARQADVRARLRSAAPRVAAWRDPQPLDLAGARALLDPGTLVLAYSLGERRSHIYAIGPMTDELQVFTIEAGESELRGDVRRMRELIQNGWGLRRAALAAETRRLGAKLLGPARLQLAKAERLLIVPDGPLHLLPFAALGEPGKASRALIESRPVHVVSSLTLYAELRRARHAETGVLRVVGFGDPTYPATLASSSEPVRGALPAGLQLLPLPGTRAELGALEQLAPHTSQLWLGDEATEERAKALGRDARIIHFACHGFTDAASPLDSGLVLAIPKSDRSDNGILQAWEVFESMRLDADLVTLSACETGLGQEVAGEGLLGLTWAFEYAGARSVLASLWEVNDRSTAALMRRFYAELRQGVSKAEALRRAQVELLRHPATTPPYFWAAFQLVGDWR